jgi:thiol-disulfide isomerase/thioredoxin
MCAPIDPRRIASLVVAVVAACSAVAAPPAGGASPPALTFELPLLDGARFVRLADFEGQPVLLNFWGSDCPPCRVEMPLLIEQAQRYPAVQFLGIAVDDRANATRFLARLEAGFPQLSAPRQPEVLMRRFGNKSAALPYTVVLDVRHRVCVTHLGQVDAAWIATAMADCGTQLTPARPPVGAAR